MGLSCWVKGLGRRVEDLDSLSYLKVTAMTFLLDYL